MATYSDLQQGSYYLIKGDEEEVIELVTILMETDSCFLIRTYVPEMEDFFVLKKDTISEIIEELDETKIAEFLDLYIDEEIDDDDQESFTEEES